MTAKTLIEGCPHDGKFREISRAIDLAVKEVIEGLRQYATPQKKIILTDGINSGGLGGYWGIRYGTTNIVGIHFGEIITRHDGLLGPLRFVLETELLVATKNPVKDAGGLQRVVFSKTVNNAEIADYVSSVMMATLTLAEAAITQGDI